MALSSMDADLVVWGGTLVTATGSFAADVAVREGRVVAVGRDLPRAAGTCVDASGCMVLPGIVDAHTHIQLDTGIYRTPDTWFGETRAAACGGVTTVVDFATQFKGQTLREAIEGRMREAEGACIDYGLHLMVTDLPAGREHELDDALDLGVSSIKLYTTYRPNYYAGDADILRLMRAAALRGMLTLVHCENDDIVTAATRALVGSGQTMLRHHGQARPILAEIEAAHRVLFLARAAGAPVYLVHCSSAEVVDMVRAARQAGQVAFCETCPQYLLLDESVYAGPDPWRFILQPPLRDREEARGLWQWLEGGEVDVVATDHCDYTRDQKVAYNDFTRTPGGLPGVETLLPLMVTYGVYGGHFDWSGLVRLLSANPARVYGLYPRKGHLQPGADADIVVYDPSGETTVDPGRLHYLADYSPYAGLRQQGHVRATIARGELIYHAGAFAAEPGRGQFVPRSCLS